tara:strand:- start:559 stop:867 length:309 start_codon:yes stop_codon:yes gene_type:complete
MAMNQYSVVESGNLGLGQVGSAVLDDDEALLNLEGKTVVAITMLEETTFTALTQSDAVFAGTGTSTHGLAVSNSDKFPSGVTIFGRWSAVTCATGLCICYLG